MFLPASRLRLLLIPILLAMSISLPAQAQPPITESMRPLLAEQGVQAAVDHCRRHHLNESGRFTFPLDQLIDLAMERFNADARDDALRIMEVATEIHPDQARAHSVLAQIAFYTHNRGLARRHIDRALELDPTRLMDVIFRKKLTLVPEDFIVPTLLLGDDFLIRPLRGSDAELDYEAVMSSRDHLKGVFGVGDWPEETLTLEEDRASLEGHEWEFARRQGFCYTVMEPDESEVLGCIYLYPARLDEFDAHIIMWVSQAAHDRGLDPVLFRTVKEWMASDWPFDRISYPGREIPFDEYWARLEEQDKGLH